MTSIYDKVDEMATKMGKDKEGLKNLFNIFKNKYKARYSGKTEDEYDNMTINELSVRVKPLKNYNTGKVFSIIVIGQDFRIRDWLSSARADAQDKAENPANAISGGWILPDGTLLDRRKGKATTGKPIGCHICIPLIEGEKYEELAKLKAEGKLKEQGCNCASPQIHRNLHTIIIDQDHNMQLQTVDLQDKLDTIDGTTSPIYYEFKNNTLYSAMLTGTFKMYETKDIKVMEENIPLSKIKTLLAGITTPYKELINWMNESTNKYKFFVTETNVASISPTPTANASRAIQFDDYEEIENMDIQTLMGYIDEEDVQKFRVGGRVLLIGSLYMGERDGVEEVRLNIHGLEPLDSTSVEIKTMQ